jgi:hypothetical protein
MTKREKMIRDWAHTQRRNRQFERHQHRYNYRHNEWFWKMGNITAGTFHVYGQDQSEKE